MTVKNILNWQDGYWRQLMERGSGLPHALLLAGPAGIGKRAFAEALAARLLCENPGRFACGECPSCRWLAGGNHPDFRLVIPKADAQEDEGSEGGDKKKASNQIRIEQIRELEDFVFMGGHRQGQRVILLYPAEAMNAAAANSLLKILEEPPATVYFILVSSRWRRLLPTIRSRCRVLMFRRPDKADAEAWLHASPEALALLPLTGGAPLLALEEAEKGGGKSWKSFLSTLSEPGSDSLALASRWESQVKSDGGMTMEELVGLMQKWVFDLALRKSTGRLRFFEGMEHKVDELIRQASSVGLIRCYNDLIRTRGLASHPLNPRLFLEELAERYLRTLAGQRK